MHLACACCSKESTSLLPCCTPCSGAKNKRQVDEISGAWGWRLEDGEVLELEKAASKVETPTGAPFENW